MPGQSAGTELALRRTGHQEQGYAPKAHGTLAGARPDGATTYGRSPSPEPPGFGAPPPPPKNSRLWLTALLALTAVVVIAACGVSGYFTFRDDSTPRAGSAPSAPGGTGSASRATPPRATASPVDIGSRATDPKPLTVKELFADTTLAIEDENTGDTRTYKIVKTQALENCREATSGQLSDALSNLGCNQVVRAAVNTENDKYGATAGVFNLKKKGHSDKVDPLIKNDQGSFAGLKAKGASSKITKASLALYWEEHGHYLVYVIICRGDGKQISLKDKNIQHMASDLLISHLATKLAVRTGTVDD